MKWERSSLTDGCRSLVTSSSKLHKALSAVMPGARVEASLPAMEMDAACTLSQWNGMLLH